MSWAVQATAVLILLQSVFRDVGNVHLIPVGDRVALHMTDLSKIFAMFRIDVETKCFSGSEDVLAERTCNSHRSKHKHIGLVGKTAHRTQIVIYSVITQPGPQAVTLRSSDLGSDLT